MTVELRLRSSNQAVVNVFEDRHMRDKLLEYLAPKDIARLSTVCAFFTKAVLIKCFIAKNGFLEGKEKGSLSKVDTVRLIDTSLKGFSEFIRRKDDFPSLKHLSVENGFWSTCDNIEEIGVFPEKIRQVHKKDVQTCPKAIYQIFQLSQLRFLSISGASYLARFDLSCFPQLETLALCSCLGLKTLGDQPAVRLKSLCIEPLCHSSVNLELAQNITFLALSVQDRDVSKGVLKKIARFTHLTSLVLTGFPGIDKLEVDGGFSSLTSLTIRQCYFSRHLHFKGLVRKLRYLTITDHRLQSCKVEGIFCSLKQLRLQDAKDLTQLDLSELRRAHNAPEVDLQTENCQKLTEILLSEDVKLPRIELITIS